MYIYIYINIHSSLSLSLSFKCMMIVHRPSPGGDPSPEAAAEELHHRVDLDLEEDAGSGGFLLGKKSWGSDGDVGHLLSVL